MLVQLSKSGTSTSSASKLNAPLTPMTGRHAAVKNEDLQPSSNDKAQFYYVSGHFAQNRMAEIRISRRVMLRLGYFVDAEKTELEKPESAPLAEFFHPMCTFSFNGFAFRYSFGHCSGLRTDLTKRCCILMFNVLSKS